MHFRSLTVNVKRCIGGFGLLLGVSVYAEFYKENGTKGLYVVLLEETFPLDWI